MVGDRQDGAATAAPSDKKLGKITWGCGQSESSDRVMVPPITWSLCVQRSVTGSGGRPVAAIVRRTLQLRKRRLIKVRRYLHQHEATLFRTGDCVVEQSTLLIVSAQ
jgi:hypothetical protein